MIPRNAHVGTNSTTLDASFGDPATIIEAEDAGGRIDAFVAALRQPWWNDAACRGMGIDLFYGATYHAAMQVCGNCQALLPCRAEAVADPTLDHGIRGGMTVAARRNARRSIRPTQQKETDQ